MVQRNLKIAVQIFGHMRTFKDCAPELYTNLLEKYDCDIFIHTWSKLNHQTKTWHNNVAGRNQDTDESEVRCKYPNIKAIKIEEQKPTDMGVGLFAPIYNAKQPSEISIFGLTSMVHSVTSANELREKYEQEHGVKYDWVVCIRPDVLLKRDVDIEKLLSTETPENIDKGMFFFTNIFTKAVSGFRNFAACDIFYFGRPEVISNILHNVPKPSDVFRNKQIYDYAPEYIFPKTAEDLGYIPYRMDYKYDQDFVILRKESLRKRLIRLYLWREKTFILSLLPGILPPIFHVKFGLFGLINFDVSLGHI